MDAAAGQDREARRAVEQAVVAHVGGSARDLALRRVEQEGCDHEAVLGEVVERTDVDVVGPLVDERIDEGGAEDRQRDDASDDCAEPERHAFEELRPREADDLALTGLGNRGPAVGHRTSIRLGRGDRLYRTDRTSDLADPEETEERRDHCADGGDQPAEDDTDEQNGDANGEPHRPQARWRDVRTAVSAVRSHVLRGFNRFPKPRVNEVTVAATKRAGFRSLV